MARWWILVAALNGAAAVIADAMARHGTDGDAMAVEWLATGARYGLIHAAALLGLAALAPASGKAARFMSAAAGWCFVAGSVLFCGGLYAMTAGFQAAILGVPYGGTLFIVGWVALVFHALLRRGSKEPVGQKVGSLEP